MWANPYQETFHQEHEVPKAACRHHFAQVPADYQQMSQNMTTHVESSRRYQGKEKQTSKSLLK